MPLQYELRDDSLLIKCAHRLFDKEHALECGASFGSKLEGRKKVILDLASVEDITQNALRILTPKVSDLQAVNAKLVIVCTTVLAKRIQAAGLDRLMECHPTLSSALGIEAKNSHGRSADFLSVVLESTRMVFQGSTGTLFEIGKPYRRGKGPSPEVEIGALVAIVSESLNGSLILSMKQEIFLKLMSNMLGEEVSVMDFEIQQGIAEFLNMILGRSKDRLSQLGLRLEQAIPTLFVGASFQIYPSGAISSIIVPLTCPAGSVYIEVLAVQS